MIYFYVICSTLAIISLLSSYMVSNRLTRELLVEGYKVFAGVYCIVSILHLFKIFFQMFIEYLK